jgi:predicted AlkP superfamily pyrophosphatase or phosphodiesterase
MEKAHPTAVILVTGLSSSLIDDSSPNLERFVDTGVLSTLTPVLPAVTCSVQSSMLTGRMPADHGIVGNGWYDRDLAEVQFWKQSNRLVSSAKVWEIARRRDSSLTCANLFWWFNMYSSVDFSVTPRPIYKADGRKVPDVYTEPPELRFRLQKELGTFPLFNFWGPAASIVSSRWIADAAIAVHRSFTPTLTLIYLPHLDYPLQALGPGHTAIPGEVRKIDTVVGKLLDYFGETGVRVIVVSEYGIEPVDDSVHINRVLRQETALRVREEEGLELLDAAASRCFAVVDHQIAHVYVKDPGEVGHFKALCQRVAGVEQVLDRVEQAGFGVDHQRSGDLVLVAQAGKWFSYDYWLDDARAPDFARTVDIHRKPGYDPLELFIDPELHFPKLKTAWTLLKRKLGFRTLFDIVPLDTTLVRGSHGRVGQRAGDRPVLITGRDLARRPAELPCTAVHDVILQHLFDAPSA